MLKDVMVCSIRCSLWRCLAIRSTAAPTAVDRSTAPSPCLTLLYAVDRLQQVYSLQSTAVYRSTGLHPPSEMRSSEREEARRVRAGVCVRAHAW